VILLLVFVVTGFAARTYHAEEGKLSVRWYSRGEAAIAAGRPEEAIQDFRTALAYSRENGENGGGNTEYDLSLARALKAAGHISAAREYLLGLGDRGPYNAELFLELARLAVAQNDIQNAIQYYDTSIYSVWPKDPIENRRLVRIELANFLMDHGQQSDAQAVLLAMATELPPDAAKHAQAGDLLLRAGENDQALKQFKIALELDRRAPGAFRGAGLAEFNLGEFENAVSDLERAERQAPLDAQAQAALEQAREALKAAK